MKTTIDIPEELFRQVKARSALIGRPVREVTIELYRHWLMEVTESADADSAEHWLEDWVSLGEKLLSEAPSRPTGTEILESDRRRLEQ